MMGKGRLCVMGLYGVGESHAPDAFAAVLNPTTDTHLGARKIHKDFTINHKVIFDYLFKSSYMPV